MRKIANTIICFLLGLFLSGCNLQQRGSTEISESVSISKKEGLFIADFNVIGDTIRNPDAIDVVIEEAWLEKLWYYEPKFFRDKIRVVNGTYQLVLKIRDFNNDYTYNQKWNIKLINTKNRIDAEMGGIAIRGVLSFDADSLSIGVFNYKTPFYERNDNEKEKIGEYQLIRKK